VKQARRELGVRYVLEGSVRKGGNRLRITAQLVEAETGNHVWAERYDHGLTRSFFSPLRKLKPVPLLEHATSKRLGF
jgi:TolB-like protein